jgi:large subunit ribosomal protein L35Ae
MKGMVVQFRKGRQTYKPRHFLIQPEKSKSKKDAEKLMGKSVEWKSTGKKPKIISGKITSTHGTKGLVRVVFEKGLPGQALTNNVEIKD